MTYYPSHVALETVAGMCTCKCTMCAIDQMERKKEVMTDETFKHVIDKLKPYYDKIKTFSFVGIGETLLDKTIDKKIKMLLESGCKSNIAVVSNCSELNKAMAQKLLDSGLHLIICSIDGINKETHEAIRIGIDYDKVKSNVLNFVKIRNEGNYNTKVFVRFVRQQKNKDEWELFNKYWSESLDSAGGDRVLVYNVHNVGSSLDNFDLYKIEDTSDNDFEATYCQDLFEDMMIYADGSVALCCCDYVGNVVKDANIFNSSLIEAYNSKTHTYYRKKIKEGKIKELEKCKGCSTPYSVKKRDNDQD